MKWFFVSEKTTISVQNLCQIEGYNMMSFDSRIRNFVMQGRLIWEVRKSYYRNFKEEHGIRLIQVIRLDAQGSTGNRVITRGGSRISGGSPIPKGLYFPENCIKMKRLTESGEGGKQITM